MLSLSEEHPMKKIALMLPLAFALLLSACNNATEQNTDNQTDSRPNEPAPKISDAPINNGTNTTARDKIDAALAISADDKSAKVKVASTDSHKKDVIKFLYRDAILSLKNDQSAEELDTLFAYADRDLQNAIALVKADSMNSYEGYADEISDCNEVRYILNLSVGNGYSIDEAADVKYNVLGNGRVRASIMLHGDEDIEDSQFDNYKDFALSCSSDGCKIADIYDSYGDSALQTVEEACR